MAANTAPSPSHVKVRRRSWAPDFFGSRSVPRWRGGRGRRGTAAPGGRGTGFGGAGAPEGAPDGTSGGMKVGLPRAAACGPLPVPRREGLAPATRLDRPGRDEVLRSNARTSHRSLSRAAASLGRARPVILERRPRGSNFRPPPVPDATSWPTPRRRVNGAGVRSGSQRPIRTSERRAAPTSGLPVRLVRLVRARVVRRPAGAPRGDLRTASHLHRRPVDGGPRGTRGGCVPRRTPPFPFEPPSGTVGGRLEEKGSAIAPDPRKQPPFGRPSQPLPVQRLTPSRPEPRVVARRLRPLAPPRRRPYEESTLR